MARTSSALLKRRLDIAEIVRKQGEVKVDELSELLNVSGVTIRQDLSYLEEQGYLKRSFGGAIYLTPTSNLNHEPNNDKADTSTLSNITLAQRCLSFIHDGDTIFLGHGNVTKKLIPYLYDKKGITLIVNDLSLALFAKEYVQGDVIVIGGSISEKYTVLEPNNLESLLSKHSLSVSILEIEAINVDNELAISDPQLTTGYQYLMQHSQTNIALLPNRLIQNDTSSLTSLQNADVVVLSSTTITEYHQQLIDCSFSQDSVNKNSAVYQNRGDKK